MKGHELQSKKVIFNLTVKYNPSGVFLVLDFEAVGDLSWLVLRPGNNTGTFIDGPVGMNDHDITV